MRVLIIEDSDALRGSLKTGLIRSGYAVDAVGHGDEGLTYAMSGVYDIIILDLMLPGRDGLSILSELRSAEINTHVLILSAKDQVDDRIRGLDTGADDYLVKPFSFDELKSRLVALVRRRYQDKRPVLSVGGLSIDTGNREVSTKGGVVALSPKEYAVLEAMCRHSGQVLTRQQLIDKTTDFDRDISDNAVEVLVCGLRRKLKDAGIPDLIRTKRGFGYFVSA